MLAVVNWMELGRRIGASDGADIWGYHVLFADFLLIYVIDSYRGLML